MGSGLRIDNMAHLGGCCCGLLFAAPMVPRLGRPQSLFETRLRIALRLVAGILVLFGFYLVATAWLIEPLEAGDLRRARPAD